MSDQPLRATGRCLCGQCRRTHGHFWEPAGESRLAIAAGCLDTPTGLTTERHIFVDDAADYYRINDDLPRDGGYPGRA